jgi:hypothetical protein
MTPLRFAITSPHQDVKRTYTSKLSIMHGVQAKRAALTAQPFFHLSIAVEASGNRPLNKPGLRDN